jgi:hypothetical protein
MGRQPRYPVHLDYINSKGRARQKFELVPFDNKSQPSDADRAHA